jgi:hypothetical protein
MTTLKIGEKVAAKNLDNDLLVQLWNNMNNTTLDMVDQLLQSMFGLNGKSLDAVDAEVLKTMRAETWNAAKTKSKVNRTIKSQLTVARSGTIAGDKSVVVLLTEAELAENGYVSPEEKTAAAEVVAAEAAAEVTAAEVTTAAADPVAVALSAAVDNEENASFKLAVFFEGCMVEGSTSIEQQYIFECDSKHAVLTEVSNKLMELGFKSEKVFKITSGITSDAKKASKGRPTTIGLIESNQTLYIGIHLAAA